MAKFSLYFDTRGRKDKNVGNISVRLVHKRDTMYFKITKMTRTQYKHVFVKKSTDSQSVKFRKDCNDFKSRCETIFAKMNPFDKVKFRDLVYDRVKSEENTNKFYVKDLLERFTKKNTSLKLKTKQNYTTAINSFIKYKPDLTIWDITVDFLKEYHRVKTKNGMSPATVSNYFRGIRRIINYFIKIEKIIPHEYEYPFGMGGVIISKHQPIKFVMSNKEIESVLNFKDFKNKEQEYARDIWAMTFYINGANYGDLYRMKWTNIQNKHFVFYRMKTEGTRTNNVKPIVAPIKPELQKLIDKVGVKNHPYILGLCEDGITEAKFNDKKDWQLRKLNKNLRYIEEKLNLSVELRLKNSRDCYASYLYRNGVEKSSIGDMMGHANSITTEHYFSTLDLGRISEINECLP